MPKVPAETPTWTVGQEVLYRPGNRPERDQAVAIAKVARKYVTVQLWGRDIQFHIDTGRAKDYHGGRILTHEMDAREKRQGTLRLRLRDLGVQLSAGAWALDPDVLEHIADCVEQQTTAASSAPSNASGKEGEPHAELDRNSEASTEEESR